MSNKKTRGVIFISTGEGYTEMAIAAASSIKLYAPKIKIHLFTDQKYDKLPENIDGISRIDNPHIRSKVDYIHQTPFDETLFLDSDTQVVSDLTELFDILERFDIALAHAPRRNYFKTLQLWNEKIPYAFPQLNSGVILFNNKKETIQLLKDWQIAYHENGFFKDQVTLRELLWKSNLRLSVLPPEFNIRFKKYIDVWTEWEATPKILHYGELKKTHSASTEETKGKSTTFNQRLKIKWLKFKWIWRQIKSLI